MAKKLYTHKQIRKSIKRDELRDLAERAVHYMKHNTENLLISLGVLAVIAFLVPLYLNHLNTSERRAAGLYNTAVGYYLQPLAGQGMASGSEVFRTREEKYKKSQQAFSEVAVTYKNTQSGKLARLGQANSLFFQNKYDEALAIYQQELAGHAKDAVGVTIRLRMAQCLESTGKYKEALDSYRPLMTDAFSRPSAQLGAARCLDKLGQKADAEKTLRELQGSDAGEYWSESARRQLALMSAAAVPLAGSEKSSK